jgi:hypothetical protein
MEFAYDLSGGSTAVLKKYHVAATNAVVGRPYTKTVDGGVGVVLGTTTAQVDYIGVNVDAPGTYAAAQNSDGSENAKTVTLIINPLAVYKARLSGGATDGTALTARTVTTAQTDGLTVVHSGYDSSSPDMDEGTIWGYTGANSGIARKITGGANGTTTVILAFPRDSAVGDQYLLAPIHPTRSIVAQLTTNCTEVDASAAISGDGTSVVTEMLLNDLAGEGTRTSYAFIQFADSLFGATVT